MTIPSDPERSPSAHAAASATPPPLLGEAALSAAGRELATPFRVRLNDANTVCVTRILRNLPGRRIAGEARIDGRTVFVKIFIGQGSERRWTREVAGVRALLERHIPTPDLVSAEALPDGGQIAVTAFLGDAVSLAARWQALAQRPAGKPGDVAWLAPVFRLLGAMHQAGLTHEDLHLGNFLASGQGLFVVDGDAVVQHAGAPVTPAEATRNLGMLIAQLPMEWDTRLAPLLAAYREGHPAAIISDDALAASIARARADRLADYMSKVRRECTLFAVSRTPGRMSVVMREHADALAPLLADPDAWIATGRMLKMGRSATVAGVECAGRPLVIKRCNIKSPLHALSRAMRPSRAWHAWVAGHRLKLLGIPTPTPLAVIEERTGPLRGRAWLITEFCEGITLRRHFDGAADREPTPDEADAIRSLFDTLYRARITHGDLKCDNLFWQDGRIALIDLDAMVQHRGAASHRRAWQKDRNRLLRNWPEGSRLHRWLAANLPPCA
ncbi:lipopolysaccharide kinase InaA family protein [Rhodocyclaceae bacterium SMB388]